jgi:hypothetical protein
MTRPKKGFDAVAMMRSIRDRISADIEGMTLEQELAWLASQQITDPFLQRLRDSVAHPHSLSSNRSASSPARAATLGSRSME